jgi:hypothetical protein
MPPQGLEWKLVRGADSGGHRGVCAPAETVRGRVGAARRRRATNVAPLLQVHGDELPRDAAPRRGQRAVRQAWPVGVHARTAAQDLLMNSNQIKSSAFSR